MLQLVAGGPDSTPVLTVISAEPVAMDGELPDRADPAPPAESTPLDVTQLDRTQQRNLTQQLVELALKKQWFGDEMGLARLAETLWREEVRPADIRPQTLECNAELRKERALPEALEYIEIARPNVVNF